MTHVLRVAALVVLIGGLTPAAAQERLELFTWIGNQPRAIEVDGSVSGFGAIGRVTSLTQLPPGGVPFKPPTVIAGGRYAAWTGPSGGHPGWDVFVFDRVTRRVSVLPAQMLPPGAYGPDVVVLTTVGADPRRPRLFLAAHRFTTPVSHVVWAIDLDGGPPVAMWSDPALPFISGFAYARDVDEIFLLANLDTVVVLDGVTGREKRRWPATGAGLVVDPGGRVAWIDQGPQIVAVDAATGSQIASTVGHSPILDEQRRVLLSVAGEDEFLRAHDPLALTTLGSVRIDFSPSLRGMFASTSVLPGRWMTGAYVVRSESRRLDGVCNAMVVDVYDPNGTRRDTADILRIIDATSGGCTAYPVLFRSPFAPSGLTAAVAGRDVTLAWRDPGDATHFELEFGFAPGQRAGSLRLGRANSLTIPGVPPGTYYLRVKAVNAVGGSPVSNEVRVVVP
ncbi:MAG: fibronectin type III domain-containing protein [Vicinamibacterales bacterium]